MKTKFILSMVAATLLSATFSLVEAQEDDSRQNHFKLESSGRQIENVINLELSESEIESLKAISGEKMFVKTKGLVINGDEIIPEEIKTRGQTTLHFSRKSLGFKLNTAAAFHRASESEKLKKFSLLNLAMDKYYIRNRLAFGMMNELGIFNLFYAFCELKINDKSEGIYMVIERPEEWAERKNESPLVIRRGYNHKIDKIDTGKKTSKNESKKYVDNFRQIYKSLNKFKGEELYNQLTQWIDLKNYMQWMAFNYLVHNGDYADEVFFYIEPETGKFKIIPWDYDDIFAAFPHEGNDANTKIPANELIFSGEDLLDVKIANDPYLYKLYLKNFKEVLEKLNPVVIQQVFEETLAELYPYYSREDVIRNAQYDVYKDATTDNLKTEMVTRYLWLIGTRDNYFQILEKEGY